MLPFLRRHIPLAAFALGFGAGEPRAIIAYITFPSLTLLEGAGPDGGAGGLTILTGVNTTSPQFSFEAPPMHAGETVAPAGGLMAEFDIRQNDSYVIPITFDVFDWAAPGGVSQVDVDPGSGQIYTVWYDMETGAYDYAGPVEGNGPGPRAILDYSIVSDPIRYDYTLMDYVWQDPEGLWHYEYGVNNGFYSTFNLESLTIPGLGTRQVDLPIWDGSQYVYEPIITDRPPASAMATLQWDDLRRTRIEVPIQVPSPGSVPEPGTAALLATGLAAMAFVARRRVLR